ncbi:MAG: flavin reductase [Betaproteobacteria bacterium HGW-Betaproteobacteria-13]|jgi:flavin reductase (DIM6/NTAB) family NADH-FMN oxidoreductase RutF|nr:MAG: flavin reductase [Betaproteobacteria bacterium HGW-Betaproteobacteria-19]PKO79174.1 MAG: flavin reductase [Betaproteobacteria bacterium HGW-Betaproteobacteria-13]
MSAQARPATVSDHTVVPVGFGRVSSEAFKGGMRRVAQGVAIASLARGSERAGLTISSFSSLCADPPRMLACISKTAGAFPLLQRGGNLAINVLAEGQEALALRFSSSSVKGDARFEVGRWETGESGAPVLDDALSVFDGRIKDIVDAGTHVIAVIDVLAVSGQGDKQALLYVDGRFATLAAEGVG